VTTGFVDTSWSKAGTSKSFQFGDGTNSRVFDYINGQPMLNNLNLQLIKNGPIGGKVELSFGQDADIIASWPTANFNSFDVTAAYVSGTMGPLTLQVGKYATLAGAEVLESPSDLNFSRSILFGYAIPFTHTGARLTWAATSALSVIAGINNGWDNTKGNGSGAHTGEGGLAYTNKNLSLSTQGYSGTEQTAYGYHNSIIDVNGIPNNWSGVLGHRSVIDAVGSYKFGPVITGILNYDDGRMTNVTTVNGAGTPNGFGVATWNGLAGYISAALTGKLTLTGRYEQFNDPQGFRTTYAQRWNEGTLTFAYAPSSSLLFRAEVRADHSSVMPWLDGNNLPINHMSSLGLEAIAKF